MTDWIAKLNQLSDSGGIGLGGGIEKLVLTVLTAVGLSLAAGVEAALNVFIKPMESLADGIGSLLDGLLGGAGDIILAGAAASAAAISDLWIFAYPGAIVVALLMGGFLYAWYLSQEETSDFIPFSVTDIPLIGADEDED